MNDMTVPSPIGQAMVRREDLRFLTGAGHYTDDVVLPRQTYGVFVRSPHAHARIRSVDTGACRAAPGVSTRTPAPALGRHGPPGPRADPRGPARGGRGVGGS